MSRGPALRETCRAWPDGGRQVKAMRYGVLLVCMGLGVLTMSAASAPRAAGQDGARQSPLAPGAARAVHQRFAGVWKLVGEESLDAKGQPVPAGAYSALGGRFGYITYDPAGFVSVVLAWVAQPTVTRPEPTAQEAAAALARYNSYWGAFAVNEAASVVTHQTFGAVSPSFAFTNQERDFTIAGNRLTLRPPASANGDRRSLTWERVPDLASLTPTHRRLIGFWKLVSFERRNAKGELLTSNPGQTGFIVYTASGHVMVHLMQPYRRRNAGGAPTPEETLATYRSYTSYFGPYTVNESGKYVTHHLDASFNSAEPGTDFQRFYQFDGRRLTLEAPVTRDSTGEEVRATISWERLSD